MIRLLSDEVSVGSGEVCILVSFDAKAARIEDKKAKGRAQTRITRHLTLISNRINQGKSTDDLEQSFREYLRDVMFSHYVDMVSINDFVYDCRKIFTEYRENITLAGFKVDYKVYNYEGEDEDVQVE